MGMFMVFNCLAIGDKICKLINIEFGSSDVCMCDCQMCQWHPMISHTNRNPQLNPFWMGFQSFSPSNCEQLVPTIVLSIVLSYQIQLNIDESHHYELVSLLGYGQTFDINLDLKNY